MDLRSRILDELLVLCLLICSDSERFIVTRLNFFMNNRNEVLHQVICYRSSRLSLQRLSGDGEAGNGTYQFDAASQRSNTDALLAVFVAKVAHRFMRELRF
jgi:hypothetical protein